MLNPFNAPIPGQSLTAEPKSRPWEKPPEISNPGKAFDFLFNSMTDERNAERLLNLLEAEVPVEALTETLLMTGVMEGKWSVDVAMMMIEPTLLTLKRMAEAAGIEIEVEDDEELDESFMILAKAKERNVSPQQVQAATEVTPSVPTGGLMSPKGMM